MTEVVIKNEDSKRKGLLPVGTVATRRNTSPNGHWDGYIVEKTGESAWGNVSPFPGGDLALGDPQWVIERLLDQVGTLKLQLQQEQSAKWAKQDRINDIISFVTGEDDWQKVEEE